MKEIDVATLLAVFQEMLGPLLWVLIALAAAATVLFVWVLLRERGLRPRRLVWAELAGLAGGIAAVAFMLSVTQSQLADIGGPIDWVLVAAIFLAGGIGTVVAAYGVLGALRRLA